MKYYGFNFRWMYVWNAGQKPEPADEKALDFLAEFGFNFVRIPTDYRFWTEEFDYFHPSEAVFRYIDSYLEACRSRAIHLSLNLHRVPGYCVNRNDLEKDNLWVSKTAQDAFVFLWETFARRYKDVRDEFLSFDLINEPPCPGELGLTHQNHAALIRRTVAAIRAIDPNRKIIINGLGGGHLPVPELTDLGVIHSTRGYQPMPITHHQAAWWSEHTRAPAPRYPGLIWKGRIWNRAALRACYRPWQKMEKRGAKIHVGEFGCFNRTPNEIAMRWFRDIFSIYKDFRWGYALWNFQGPFGIVEHARPGAKMESICGYQVDRGLLDLMLEGRFSD